MKRKETAEILRMDEIAESIFSMTLRAGFAAEVCAGQFVSVFTKDASRLLPRPISICEADAEEGTIRLVFRIAGAGTGQLAALCAGDAVEILGPLGNGFPLGEAAGKQVLLVGGGIGIPPMLCTAEQLLAADAGGRPSSVTAALGYRTDDTYLLGDLEKLAPVLVATDDGSRGTKGTVLDAVRAAGIRPDLVFACGPKVMLRAVSAYAAEAGAACYISMEERMACGVGACLGCVTKTAHTDPHSMVRNARVCTEGPVFSAEEVDLS